jgi:hypothetical protein
MPDRNELVERIVEKAWKDEVFKAKLMKDPKAALESMNIKLPQGLKVQVHEETADTVHLVIPQNPSMAELPDEDLEAVAGGGGLDEWTLAC